MLTNKITAELITETGSDLMVVNAARVSFKKTSTKITAGDEKLIKYLAEHKHWTPFSHPREMFAFIISNSAFGEFVLGLDQTDVAGLVWGTYTDEPKVVLKHSVYGWANLLNKIFNNQALANKIGHSNLAQVYTRLTTNYPVSTKYLLNQEVHDFYKSLPAVFVLIPDEAYTDPVFTDITIRQNVPICIARQDFKHMVGRTFNEVSRRYVDDEPAIYHPDVWRGRAKNKKQGSLDTRSEQMYEVRPSGDTLDDIIQEAGYEIIDFYSKLVSDEVSVAPEQARMILPQSMMTEYFVTAHLAAWNRMIEQRTDPHAQAEIRDLAIAVQEQITIFFQNNLN